MSCAQLQLVPPQGRIDEGDKTSGKKQVEGVEKDYKKLLGKETGQTCRAYRERQLFWLTAERRSSALVADEHTKAAKWPLWHRG